MHRRRRPGLCAVLEERRNVEIVVVVTVISERIGIVVRAEQFGDTRAARLRGVIGDGQPCPPAPAGSPPPDRTRRR